MNTIGEVITESQVPLQAAFLLVFWSVVFFFFSLSVKKYNEDLIADASKKSNVIFISQ